MVFKMVSTGSHIKKMNGNIIKDDKYQLRVNPYNKGLVYLKTNQKKGNKYEKYENNFNNREDFMKNFLAIENDRSLFKMNKNIEQTKKRKPYVKRKIEQGKKKFDKRIRSLKQTLKKNNIHKNVLAKRLRRKINTAKKR
tara:strand:- start:234 stop:650 length:417 start_codon:yes stop_codon:yes gene_type:complete